MYLYHSELATEKIMTLDSNTGNEKSTNIGASNQIRYKVLIVYKSGYGSTAEVAQKIGKYLSEEGAIATVHELPDVDNLSQYDAVIIGSAIRYDRWMSDARKFVITNQALLSKLPVAFFFNCLTLAQRTDETEKKAKQYAKNLYTLSSQVKPLCVGRFAGVLDYHKMPFLLRLIFKVLGSVVGLQEGDYRDWNEIRQWTKDVGVKLRKIIILKDT